MRPNPSFHRIASSGRRTQAQGHAATTSPMHRLRQSRLVRRSIAIALALSLHAAQAGEDRSHDELAHSVTNELLQVFVNAGLCRTRAECSNNSRVLFSSSSSGLHFEIYDLTEAQIIGSAFEVLGRRGRELPVGKKLQAKFVSHSKAADIKRSALSRQPIHASLEVWGSGSAAAR